MKKGSSTTSSISLENSPARTKSLERTSSSSSSNSELIEPVGDEFFDASKKYVMKKLELEVLKEQLDSAEYQEAYPNSDNIYYKLHGETLSIDSLDEVEEVEDTKVISRKITEKEGEISKLKDDYEGKKTSSNGSQSQLILFVDTLDNYIKNKEDLRTIIKDINKIVQTAIPLSEKLGEIEAIGWKTPQTEREKILNLNKNWVPNFSNYQTKIKEIRKLFHKIYEHDIHKKSLLTENDNLYIKLSSPKLFNTDGLFYKATYDSEEIISLFDGLYNNVFFDILKDYHMYNDFVKIKIDPRLSSVTGKSSIFVYKEENDELRAKVSRLEFKLSQLESSDLPKSREREQLRRISNLTQDEKRRLTQKMNSEIERLRKKNDTKVNDLNRQIQELKARSIQTTDKGAGSIDAANIEEMNKRLIELTDILDAKLYELEDAKKLLDTPKENIDSELKMLESKQDSNGFLKLVIESADLYETENKEEFKASFEKLLNYQPKEYNPDDKFMFKYVFNEIETNKPNYDYLDEFLKTQVKIPEQIEQDKLFPQIMGSLTIKPAPQTHL